MKLSELARLTGATLENADADVEINGAAGMDDAANGQVTFFANPRYITRIQTTRASAIYVGEGVAIERDDIAILRARDPYLAYTRALRVFHPAPSFKPFIHPSAVIDATASLASDVWVGACAVIGRNVHIGATVRVYPNGTIYDDVEIGAGCVIHSGVAIREGTRLGERVIVHNNTVIGSDGFGYA